MTYEGSIAITGMGAVSGFGRGVDALWSGLVEGRRATARRPGLGALDVSPIALALPWSDDGGARADTIASWAAEEALRNAGPRDVPLTLCFGTTKGGIGPFLDLVRNATVPSPPARATYAGTAFTLAKHLRAQHVEVVSAACVSSNVAIGNAVDLLRRGEADRVLAGGVDVLSDFVISGFASLKALDESPSRPFDAARRGLNLGEGAAFLVLERNEDPTCGRPLAYIEGYGLAADAVHMTGPDREGRGASNAIYGALGEANLSPIEIDFISAHGTATVFNDLMEDKALRRVFGAYLRPLSSIKGAIGHTLGAAAALEAVMCVRVLQAGIVPPTVGHETRDPEIAQNVVAGVPLQLATRRRRHALSTSSGFGGTNAAIVIGSA